MLHKQIRSNVIREESERRVRGVVSRISGHIARFTNKWTRAVIELYAKLARTIIAAIITDKKLV